MENLPKMIMVKREIWYNVEDLAKEIAEDYDDSELTEEQKYVELIDRIYEYACEDLARSWNKITMVNGETAQKIDYEKILKS